MLCKRVCGIVFLALVGVSPISAQNRLAEEARRGDTRAVRLMLSQKTDVNASTGDGMSALHWGAYNNNLEMVEALIAAGANVNATTRTGAFTPLLVAVTNGSASVVPPLLRAGAAPNARTQDGATALMLAAASGNTSIVKNLLDHGADIDAADLARGQTALMFASAADRESVVTVLLKAGANGAITSTVVPPAEMPRTNTPGSVRAAAAEDANDPIAQARANRRVAPAKLGGWAALHFASREGSFQAARALIDGGANINQGNESDGTTPLVTAIINGHYDLAKLFLDRGADPNQANDDGLAPLYATIDMQFAPVIWQPNPSTEQEQTSYLQLMTLLLDRGAAPNLRLKKKLWFRPSDHDDAWTGTAGTTAFWRAAFATDVDAMRLLVSRGADPSIPSLEGVTPLMAAAGLGWTGNQHRTVPDSWVAAVKYCLELGADVNARDIFQYSALHAAAYRGDNALVKFLVDKGARLDAVTIFGDNVSDMADAFVAFGSNPRAHPETVELLSKLGAPPVTPGERPYCTASQLTCPRAANVR